MRAARLYAPRTIRYDDVPVPAPCAAEVLVRVGAVGLCGSDLHYYCDGHIGPSVPSEPLRLGHRFAATIEAVAPAVEGLRCGAGGAMRGGVGDAVADVLKLTAGRGVDVSFEAAGALATPQQGIDMLRPGGTLVLVGICPEDRIPLAASTSRRKGVTIK